MDPPTDQQQLKILYGSETGNAQEFSEQLWKTCRFHSVNAECMALDDFPIENLNKHKLIIFIVATGGQGEVPTNMRKSWSFLLSRKLPEGAWLSNVGFALLGLGDSSYQKYNYAAKKLYRRLIQLGARPLLSLELADEQHQFGIDGIYDKWIDQLLTNEQFKKLLNQSVHQKITLSQPSFCIDFNATKGPESTKFYPLESLQNERLTDNNHFQDTRLIKFSMRGTDLRYTPGDVLMVIPENLSTSVEITQSALLSCQPFLHKTISICRTDPRVPTSPQFYRLASSPNSTLNDCLYFYFDLQSIPKRNFIKQLAIISEDELEKERLTELSSNEGIDDYLDYCVYSKRTLAEFLRDFPETSASLTPSDLFELFPCIRPKAFSIASSPSAHPEEIHILVARVKYNVRKMKSPRLGLCSNFLCDIVPGQIVYVRIRPGIFHVNGNEPLIMFGPGTGVAPFRSMISENEFANPGSEILLFFGCRGEHRDFYFKDEWNLKRKAKIIAAFSRDHKMKIYVQHKIPEKSEEIWELINRGAKILIAGSAGEMPKDVISAIKKLVIDHGGISTHGVDKYIEVMEKNKCIQYETWS